jgi:hypothetical protein
MPGQGFVEDEPVAAKGFAAPVRVWEPRPDSAPRVRAAPCGERFGDSELVYHIDTGRGAEEDGERARQARSI